MTKEALFACVEEQRAALLSMADDIYDHPELGLAFRSSTPRRC